LHDDHVVADVGEAYSFAIDWGVGVLEDQCDVDLTVSRHL
jgi:hypothetical protein